LYQARIKTQIKAKRNKSERLSFNFVFRQHVDYKFALLWMSMDKRNSPHLNTALPSVNVCVLTPRGMAAISSIALTGQGASAVLGHLFSRPVPQRGNSVYGTINGDFGSIDSVVVSCEDIDCYVIHCHGNPLLVEQIVSRCCRFGAVLQSSEEFLFSRFHSDSKTLIEAEARLAMTKAASLEAVTLLNRQITGGLSAWAAGWIGSKCHDINRLRKECSAIIKQSGVAKRLLEGIRAVLIGPPNSGKSTLLNRLAGAEEVLVSDTAGTTRDWVSIVCRIGPLRVELFDTAGLDEHLAAASELDQAAQQSARQVMASAELVLELCECTQSRVERSLVIPEVSVIKVFTKSDLLKDPVGFTADISVPWVLVSAADGEGIESLLDAILSAMQIDMLSENQPICFTQRQFEIVCGLSKTTSCDTAVKALQLLIGQYGPQNT
jgi:tRNA modification GTPase